MTDEGGAVAVDASTVDEGTGQVGIRDRVHDVLRITRSIAEIVQLRVLDSRARAVHEGDGIGTAL